MTFHFVLIMKDVEFRNKYKVFLSHLLFLIFPACVQAWESHTLQAIVSRAVSHSFQLPKHFSSFISVSWLHNVLYELFTWLSLFALSLITVFVSIFFTVSVVSRLSWKCWYFEPVPSLHLKTSLFNTVCCPNAPAFPYIMLLQLLSFNSWKELWRSL